MVSLFCVRGLNCLVTGGIGYIMFKSLVIHGCQSIRPRIAMRHANNGIDWLWNMDPMVGHIPLPWTSVSRVQLSTIDPRGQPTLLWWVARVLINNAGATWGGESLETYADGVGAWNKMLALNVKSVFHMTKLAYPMLKSGAQRNPMYNQCDQCGECIAGLYPPETGNLCICSASKAAVHQLSKHLTKQTLCRQHLCQLYCPPGYIPTRMTKETLNTFGEEMREMIPLNRFGKEDDIAGITLFLLSSRASDYITGDVRRRGALIKAHLWNHTLKHKETNVSILIPNIFIYMLRFNSNVYDTDRKSVV